MLIVVRKFNEERVLTNVGRDALELESLEARPSQQSLMGRSELAEVLGEVFGITGSSSVCSSLLDLSGGVLADSPVCRPMVLLAILRLWIVLDEQKKEI